MYKLKAVAQRSALLTAAAVVAVAAYMPAPSALADALNPLTDRSLTLSSSAPGWQDTDGSGNATYAPPNSGANGKKTGNTFDFKVSTDSSSDPIKAFTFQYCTASAGTCTAPGDNVTADDERGGDTSSTSDLNVVTAQPAEVTDFGAIVDNTNGDVKAIPQAGIDYDQYYGADSSMSGFTPNSATGNFIVYYEGSGGTWSQSTGWEMAASNNEDGQTVSDAHPEVTGKNNFITLTNEDGEGFTSNTRVKIVFFANDTNYITNPGSKEFFVKINSYNDDEDQDESTLVDGGVTVANVMNHSISIQTKVLETMDFSVGTVDPNTLESDPDNAGTSEFYDATGREKHAPCDRILTGMTPSDPTNVLKMGSADHENSLRTDTTYSTHSYWRLSSNSSAGATVYYSGMTLSNTVGDKIDAIGPDKEAPQIGAEQFGLAIANDNDATALVNYAVERGSDGNYENGADNSTNGVHATVETDLTPSGGNLNESYHVPRLSPLVAHTDYSDGVGVVNDSYGTINTKFAFDNNSNLIPVPIASQSTEVVDCVTAKMRYIANIAATTPAGIYTTKINYIAAPQY